MVVADQGYGGRAGYADFPTLSIPKVEDGIRRSGCHVLCTPYAGRTQRCSWFEGESTMWRARDLGRKARCRRTAGAPANTPSPRTTFSNPTTTTVDGSRPPCRTHKMRHTRRHRKSSHTIPNHLFGTRPRSRCRRAWLGHSSAPSRTPSGHIIEEPQAFSPAQEGR